MRKPMFWFPTWSDTNQAVQLQKMASGWIGFRKKRDRAIYVAKTKASICAFVFAYAKRWFSHDVAHLVFQQFS